MNFYQSFIYYFLKHGCNFTGQKETCKHLFAGMWVKNPSEIPATHFINQENNIWIIRVQRSPTWNRSDKERPWVRWPWPTLPSIMLVSIQLYRSNQVSSLSWLVWKPGLMRSHSPPKGRVNIIKIYINYFSYNSKQIINYFKIISMKI